MPAAYIRSSTSTVSGRKSTSRRLPAVAVQRTIVSPGGRRRRRRPAWPSCRSRTRSRYPRSRRRRVVTASCSYVIPFWPARRSAGRFASLRSEQPRSDTRSIRSAPPGASREGGRRRRRPRRAAPSRTSRAHPRGDRVGAAPVGLEAVEVEAQRSARGPQVRVVDAPLVGEQRVVERPERALAAPPPRPRGRGTARGCFALQREVAEDDAHAARRLQRARAATAQYGHVKSAYTITSGSPRGRGRGRRARSAGGGALVRSLIRTTG